MSSQWGSHYAGFQPPCSLAQVPGPRSGEATDDELRHIQAGTVDRLRPGELAEATARCLPPRH